MKKRNLTLIALALVVGLFALGAIYFHHTSIREKDEKIQEGLEKIIIIKDDMSDLRNQINEKGEIIINQMKELDVKDEQIKKLKDEYYQMLEELRAIDEELSVSEKSLSEADNTQLRKAVDSARRTMDRARNDIGDLIKRENYINAKTMKSISASNNDVKLKYQKLIEKNKTLNLAILDKNDMIDKQLMELLEARRTIVEKDKAFLSLQSKLDSKTELVQSYQDSIQKRNKVIAQKDEKIDAVVNNYNSLESDMRELTDDHSKLTKAINIIAKKSFKAEYFDGKGMLSHRHKVSLDVSNKHRSKKVKEIDISFLVGKEYIKKNETVIMVLELFDSKNNLVSPSYSRDITIYNFRGHHMLKLNERLKRGNYYFKVSYKGVKIHKYDFKIS